MPYNPAVVEGLISFISKALDKNEQNSIIDWITKNLFNSSELDLKQAFVKAQRIVLTEYLTKGYIDKIQSLLGTINACENEKLTRLECEILADVCLEQKEFLSANTKSHKALTEILEKQRDTIKDENLKESVEGKITEVQQFTKESITSIPSLDSIKTLSTESVIASTPIKSTVIKKHKLHIYNFLENLFKIGMSEDVLVDIIINDKENDNQTTIVGRPKVLGSSTKQMRHVTPYSFIETAIKAKIRESQEYDVYKSYITNIVSTIIPLIKSKDGICLTADQYSKFILTIGEDSTPEVFRMSTMNKERIKNEYHLIYNYTIVKQFNDSKDFIPQEKEKAKNDFNKKFEKYITHGINYLTEEILDPKDVNTVTMVCEGITRIILTLFNQNQYAAFPKEGNSLLEEIRLYKTKDEAQQAVKLKIEQQKYTVESHAKITKDNNILQYDSCIRIVDNEGSRVKKSSEALYILNSLVSNKRIGISQNIDSNTKQHNYNTQYNFSIKIDDVNLEAQYNQSIDFLNNLADVFQHHVAKHLYAVFDFKPLEEKVLAPKQHGDTETIKVYTSANGHRQAEYSVQDGIQYRELEVNGARGYNDAVIFRSDMNVQDIKKILGNKIISHTIISLIPFKGLRTGCVDDETQKGMKEIFDSFVELVQKDYENARSKDKDMVEVKLDSNWKEVINKEYVQQIDLYDINMTGQSIPVIEDYDL